MGKENRNLPKGWIETSLINIVDRLQYGYTAKASAEIEEPKYLRITDIQNGDVNWSNAPGCKITENELEKYRLYDGDIVFARSGSIEKAYRVSNPPLSAFASYLIRGKPLHKSLSFFLAYFVKSKLYLTQIGAYGSGIAIQNINAKKLGSVRIPIPPLNEQKRIITKIEKLQSHSNSAREALETIPDLLEQLRQSILSAAFRGDLTKSWREKNSKTLEPATELLKRIRAERRKRWEESELEKLKAKGLTGDKLKDEFAKRKKKYKEPEPVDTSGLPELPEGWCWVSAELIVPVYAPIVYGIILPGPNLDKGVPYIRPLEIQNDEIVVEPIPRTSPEIALKYDRAKISTGDIVLSIVGTIGKVAIVPDRLEGGNITQSSARLRPWRKFITEQYLAEALRSPILRQQYEKYRFGNAVQRLNIAHVRSLAIPLPPIKEQKILTEAIKQRKDISSAFFSIIEKCREELRILENKVLEKAFQGDLVPQDPNDEPASTLLKRILEQTKGQFVKTTKKKQKGRLT